MSDAPTLRSAPLRALLLIVFLFPVVLCAVFFPTPAPDLREHINLGLTFPLYTPKNPPLQTWLAGVLALTGARDGWLYVLVAQILNFIGIFYLALTARKFISPQAVVPVVLMACGTVYYSGATPSMALNADQIQVPVWAAFFYYALSAAQDGRWKNWLLAGALAGIGFLAKSIAAIILAVFLCAVLASPAYRRALTSPRFFAAGALTVAIAAVGIVPGLFRSDLVQYGALRFNPGAPFQYRLWWTWEYLRSFVLYGALPLITLAVLRWRGTASWPRLPDDPAQRIIAATAAGIAGVLFLIVVFAGFAYTAHYTFPVIGLVLLAIAALVEIKPEGVPEFLRITLGVWIAVVGGTLAYTQFVIHRVFREPAPAGAALLRDAWDRQYRCGPRFVLGDPWTARAIAINFGRPAFGVAFDEVRDSSAAERDQLLRQGAIVVVTPDRVWPPDAEQFLKGRPLMAIEVPYRRTWRNEKHTYQYYFAAPAGC